MWAFEPPLVGKNETRQDLSPWAMPPDGTRFSVLPFALQCFVESLHPEHPAKYSIVFGPAQLPGDRPDYRPFYGKNFPIEAPLRYSKWEKPYVAMRFQLLDEIDARSGKYDQLMEDSADLTQLLEAVQKEEKAAKQEAIASNKAYAKKVHDFEESKEAQLQYHVEMLWPALAGPLWLADVQVSAEQHTSQWHMLDTAGCGWFTTQPMEKDVVFATVGGKIGKSRPTRAFFYLQLFALRRAVPKAVG